MSTPATDLFEALVSAASRKPNGTPESEGEHTREQDEPSRSMTDARTYRGRSIQELVPQIQRELGHDAIIVRRREGLTGGIAGFFQHRFVEVDAVCAGERLDLYDADPSTPATPPVRERAPIAPPPDLSPPYSRESIRPRPGATHSPYITEHLAALARAERMPLKPATTDPPFSPPQPPSAPSSGVPEFFELTPRELASPPITAPPPIAASTPSRSAAKPQRTPPSSRPGEAIERSLLDIGISQPFAAELIASAATHILPLAPHAGLAKAVRATLAQRIPVTRPLPTSGAAIVIVGPGGSGKTSCVAALLGAYRKSSTLPASCATLTRDSLSGDLQILLSPHLMHPTPIDSPRAVKALKKIRKDGMVVLDTLPLSAADRASVRKLAGLLRELEPERVVIAMPATLGAKAAAQLLEALKPLKADALAVTHADETDQIGIAVETSCKFGLAPEYLLDRRRGGGWRLARMDPTDLAARLLQ